MEITDKLIPKHRIPHSFNLMVLLFSLYLLSKTDLENCFYHVRSMRLRPQDQVINQVGSLNLKVNRKNETHPEILTFMELFLKSLDKKLETEITQAVNSGKPRCRPDCTYRTNRLILTNQGSAGLNDRTSVLYHVGNLASYFCAFIVVDKPCELLNSKKHGQSSEVSCDLEWSDFKSFKRYHGSGIDFGNDELILNKSFELKVKNKELVLNGASIENFDKAVSLFDNNIEFIWEIDTNYYKFRKILWNYFNEFLREQNTPFPVVYKKDEVSFSEHRDELECVNPPRYANNIVQIAKAALLKSGINSEFGSLHIRRGDAVRECNTAMSHVKTYLKCSLKACKADMGDFPVIFFTDERNEVYINRVDELLTGLNHTMINGEILINNIIQDSIETGSLHKKYDNNFFRFEVGGYIKKAARFQLAQRRKMQCAKCDRVCIDKRRKRDTASVFGFNDFGEVVFYLNF